MKQKAVWVGISTTVATMSGLLGYSVRAASGQQQPDWRAIRAAANPQYDDQRDYIPSAYGRLVSVDGQWQTGGDGRGGCGLRIKMGRFASLASQRAATQGTTYGTS